MKIGENDINHNALRLIQELCIWDMFGERDENLRIMALGYIQGICEMASELKKVIKE